jgi:hypothetical protein
VQLAEGIASDEKMSWKPWGWAVRYISTGMKESIDHRWPFDILRTWGWRIFARRRIQHCTKKMGSALDDKDAQRQGIDG